MAKRTYKKGPFTKREIAFLKQEYPAKSALVLASRMKRSLVSVQRQLRVLGIGKKMKTNWSPKQLRLLRSLYRQTPVWEIANRLNMSPSHVRRKAVSMGLKK